MMKSDLSKATQVRDTLQRHGPVLSKIAHKVRVEIAALALARKVYQVQHRQQLERDARERAHGDATPLVREGRELAAPWLGVLQELEAEAERRKISREEVLTEQALRVARFVEPYQPKEFIHAPGDHRPVIGDPITNALANGAEQDRAERAELRNTLHEMQHALTLPKVSAAELARQATDAATRGDAALLNAVWREHESRSYANDATHAMVSTAVRQAIQAIPLPDDYTAMLALLDQIADAEAGLRRTLDEIDSGETPAAEKSRRVTEQGEGYADQRRADAAALDQAVQRRAGQLKAAPPVLESNALPADVPDSTTAPQGA